MLCSKQTHGVRRYCSRYPVSLCEFDRWRQENFFKYLREEYALDALVEYATVPDDPKRFFRRMAALRRVDANPGPG